MPSAIEQIELVKFKGHVRDGNNLSAIGMIGDLLIAAGDEDDRLQVLRRDGANYELLADQTVPLNSTGAEADLEGIACEGDTVYAIGSHSCTRPKVKETESAEQNRSHLERPAPPSPFRDVLATFRLAHDGTHSALTIVNTFRDVIDATPVLQPFARIPCKENGVDIEGLAIRNGRLHVGFRGPVLQHGFVPVLITTFAADGPLKASTVLLNLGGLGVRDLECVSDGFLVLAGPVADVPLPFELLHWDGNDCVPGSGGEQGRLIPLGTLPPLPGAKAEGLTLEAESKHHYTVLIVFDGLKEGGPIRFRVTKPV